MGRDDLVAFVRQHRLAVVATAAVDGRPSAALVGIAVSDDFELVFDTDEATHKAANLRANPKVALVVGWEGERTLQIDGLADEPTGSERERLRQVYFDAFPDGRDRLTWPGIAYVRVTPTRARYSDLNTRPPTLVALDFPS